MKPNQIFQQCLDRTLEPEQAVDAIDTEIGGITAVHFKAGKLFTICNHTQCYSMPYRGLGNRQEKMAQNLAYMAYRRAQMNGNPRCGELHIGRYASTKHHNACLN